MIWSRKQSNYQKLVPLNSGLRICIYQLHNSNYNSDQGTLDGVQRARSILKWPEKQRQSKIIPHSMGTIFELYCNNRLTSTPKVKLTPRSFSPQPFVSLSGSDHSRSHSRPWSGTSVGRIIRRICSIDFRSGLIPPWQQKIFSSTEMGRRPIKITCDSSCVRGR